ncbi:hypothetical protein NDU88_002636 [Pleurodeles waltl]|uniref:Uncharacterized protein n=1 Tax=Pleurodeles waltl TaxID=8319 RepID=A0AAV7T2N4_PLEWA|nr:hypothetical protein NDU88_002636 [Pleurodeles waltl]
MASQRQVGQRAVGERCLPPPLRCSPPPEQDFIPALSPLRLPADPRATEPEPEGEKVETPTRATRPPPVPSRSRRGPVPPRPLLSASARQGLGYPAEAHGPRVFLGSYIPTQKFFFEAVPRDAERLDAVGSYETLAEPEDEVAAIAAKDGRVDPDAEKRTRDPTAKPRTW